MRLMVFAVVTSTTVAATIAIIEQSSIEETALLRLSVKESMSFEGKLT